MKESDIILRAIEPSDVDLLYKWENDQSIWHLSNTVAPFSRFVLEQYILSSHQDVYTNKQLRLMIDLKTEVRSQKSEVRLQDEQLTTNNEQLTTIGSIDLFDFEPMHKRAGVGILLDASYRSKGYASKALDELIYYCFNKLNLRQLYCNISSDNDVSMNLFKKHKFEVIGVKKDWLFINNKWVDEYLLQLINNKQG